MAKDRQKKIDRIEKFDKPQLSKKQVKMKFEDKRATREIILDAKNLSIGYETPLISNINFTMRGYEKLAIVGPNGTGKTTLLKVIEKKLKPLKGNVNARRKVVESDWKDYTSSSNLINDYISKKSKIGMLFEIITLTKGGKFELKYCEMKHQVLNNCLFDEKCLNGIINVRLGKNKKISLDKIL